MFQTLQVIIFVVARLYWWKGKQRIMDCATCGNACTWYEKVPQKWKNGGYVQGQLENVSCN